MSSSSPPISFSVTKFFIAYREHLAATFGPISVKGFSFRYLSAPARGISKHSNTSRRTATSAPSSGSNRPPCQVSFLPHQSNKSPLARWNNNRTRKTEFNKKKLACYFSSRLIFLTRILSGCRATASVLRGSFRNLVATRLAGPCANEKNKNTRPAKASPGVNRVLPC